MIGTPNASTLAALSVTGLATGSLEYLQSRRTIWSYHPFDTSPADGAHIPAQVGNWVYHSAGNASSALAQAVWQIDPVGGSDDATGLAGAPLKTFAEIVRRWGTRTPLLTVGVTISWLSSAPSTDPVVINPIFVGAGSLALTNAGLTATTTTTIGTFTAKNRAAGTLNKITAVGVSTWTAGTLVHDTTNGTSFFIEADLGGGTAAISEPFAIAGIASFFGPTAQSPANGHAIVIYAAPPTVYMPSLESQTFTAAFNLLVVQALTVTSEIITRATTGVLYAECIFRGAVVQASGAPRDFGNTQYNSCWVDGDGFGGFGEFYGGVIAQISQWQGFVYLDGDVIVQLRAHSMNAYLLLGTVYFGQTNNENEDSVSQFVVQNSVYGPAGGGAVWGPGPFNCSGGSTLRILVTAPTATAAMLVTGGLQLDGVATGFTFNTTTGAYSAGPVALTPAALDSNKSFSNPHTGSRMMVL